MATSEPQKPTRQLRSSTNGDGQRAEFNAPSVHEAIAELRHAGDIQFKRIAQMQVEIDRLKATLAKLTGE